MKVAHEDLIGAMEILKTKTIEGYEEDGSKAPQAFIDGIDAFIAMTIFAYSLEDKNGIAQG